MSADKPTVAGELRRLAIETNEPGWVARDFKAAMFGLATGGQPVECDLCGWKGRRMRARSRPCPSCGNGMVQFQ